MKKLVLFAAVVVAVSFASCKQKTQEAPVAPEVEIEETTVVDSTTVPADTLVEAISIEEVK